MEPTNRSTYKRQNMSAEFTNSCLGKIIILAVIAFILLIVAIATVPSEEEIRVQMTDDILKTACADSLLYDCCD